VLATPGFLLLSSAQMADVPLSAYMLSTCILLQFSATWPQARGAMLVLAGLSAGFAAWTKNEGMLFVVALLAATVIAILCRRGSRDFRDLLKIGCGLAPMLGLLLSFKMLLAPPTYYQFNTSGLERLMDVERYLQIASAFIRHAASFDDAVGGMHPFVLVALGLLFFSGTVPTVEYASKHTSLLLRILAPLMLCGYFAIYLITPFNLQWHLQTSLDRLLLQLWPMCVFVLLGLPILPGLAGRWVFFRRPRDNANLKFT
jgi:hypothetical protein